MAPSTGSLLLQLGRFKMVVFSAVTYAAGATLALQRDPDLTFSASTFLIGYAFVLSCQLVAHYSGEYFDLASDKLNTHSTPLTGGSKVLVGGLIAPRLCLACSLGAAACSVLSLLALTGGAPLLLSRDAAAAAGANTAWSCAVLSLGAAMLALAHQYSAPPLRLNHNALGELGAATVMNVLLPWFAALLQDSASDSDSRPRYASATYAMTRLAPLVVPGALFKFSLFLVLNMEDRRPDWLAGKNTLPVVLGETASARLAGLSIVAGYASAFALYAVGSCKLSTLIGMLLDAPDGLKLALTLMKEPLPYRLARIVLVSLKHAPWVIMGVFADCLARELWYTGPSWSLGVRCLPCLPFLLGFMPKRNKRQAAAPRAPNAPNSVVIVGGGIGGLTLAAALSSLGIGAAVVERCGDGDRDHGADLALWPGAADMLRALGVGEGTGLWEGGTYPVDTVYMTRDRSSSSSSSGGDSNGQEQVLKKVDMAAVCMGLGRKFCLVSRERLVAALSAVVPRGALTTARVAAVGEDASAAWAEAADGSAIARGRVVVGADGIRSLCRAAVVGEGGDAEIRDGGEVCYRGVVDLRGGQPGSALSDIFEANELNKPNSMSIVYGDGIRYSWGYIDATRTTGYWFVKQMVSTGDASPHETWPEPLRTFAAHNPQGIYKHSIQDRAPLPRWSTSRVTLIGDACHAVTPNNGQGACMAIEDAFVLAVLLRRYWDQPDGHVEAFYQYERARRAHTARIHAESYKQMRIGQLAPPLRDAVLRLLPVGVMQRKLRAANVFDARPWLTAYAELRAKHQ